MNENDKPLTKIKTFLQKNKAEKDDRSLFEIIYGAGLILAFLSVLSAIAFLIWLF